jgi:hypothetical protein
MLLSGRCTVPDPGSREQFPKECEHLECVTAAIGACRKPTSRIWSSPLLSISGASLPVWLESRWPQRVHLGSQLSLLNPNKVRQQYILRPCYNLIGSGALPAHDVSLCVKACVFVGKQSREKPLVRRLLAHTYSLSFRIT